MNTMTRGSLRDFTRKAARQALPRDTRPIVAKKTRKHSSAAVRIRRTRVPRFSLRAVVASLVLHLIALFPMALPAPPIEDDWCPCPLRRVTRRPSSRVLNVVSGLAGPGVRQEADATTVNAGEFRPGSRVVQPASRMTVQ